MINSKSWNWEEVKGEFWNIPSEDVYYYLDRWNKKEFKKFLDLGCGLGRHSILFAQNGFETYSFDLSEYGINFLRQQVENLNLSVNAIVGDIMKLPYKDDYFDCILAYHVISHTDTKGIKKIISELERVLRMDGEFFITLCSKNSPSYSKKGYPKIDENTIVKTDEPEKGIPHFYSDIEDVRSLLSSFEIIRIRHIQDFFDNTSSWHYFIHGKKKI